MNSWYTMVWLQKTKTLEQLLTSSKTGMPIKTSTEVIHPYLYQGLCSHGKINLSGINLIPCSFFKKNNSYFSYKYSYFYIKYLWYFSSRSEDTKIFIFSINCFHIFCGGFLCFPLLQRNLWPQHITDVNIMSTFYIFNIF